MLLVLLLKIYGLRFNHIYENNSTYGGRQVNMYRCTRTGVPTTSFSCTSSFLQLLLHVVDVQHMRFAVSLTGYAQMHDDESVLKMTHLLYDGRNEHKTARTWHKGTLRATNGKKTTNLQKAKNKMLTMRRASQVNIHLVKVFRLTSTIKTRNANTEPNERFQRAPSKRNE